MTNHALVTGSAKRIGRSIALHLANKGYAISAHYNTSESEAHQLVSDIQTAGGQAVAVQADLSNMDDVKRLEVAASRFFGPINLLINNASTFENDDVETVSTDSWDHHMKPNLQAPIFLCQAMARRLPDSQNGLIVNMIDQRVWAMTPLFLSYTLSKAALWSATQTLAQALAPRIRVNGIGPGPTISNVRQSNEDFQNQVDGTILKIQPQLEEIAAAIDFILKAPSMTGQMIALDSGQHLAWETPDVLGSSE